MSEELIAKLKKLAARAVRVTEDCNAYDVSGGNFDDAYSAGLDDGETYAAREILDQLGITYS